jgi:ribosomal protein L7/L12
MMDDVKVLARTPGSKIAAIKLYREQTGASLKEAKDAVERMAGVVSATKTREK